MKTKLTNRRRKKIKKFSTTLSNKSISYRQNNLFYSLPVIILDHIASYLKGSDALNFAECITNDALTAERKFWKTLGPYKLAKWPISCWLPREDFYFISPDYFVQKLSDRRYARFYYYAFLPYNMEKMTKYCGAVLNSLLIHALDSSGQDLDFFWIGGSWLDFRSQIDRFRRRSKSHIIQETNLHGKTLGFHQAIATRTFINYKLTQHVHDVHLYIDRCFKYHSRGFTWLCPIKFHDLLVQKPLICASKTIDYGFNDFYFNVDSFRVQECFLDLHPFDDDE
ncbi:unnamed protein product [Rotaria sordida]|uniref:Uncharacterized protein n=1 Tax=Rotaria sordida TaxID=392033 RepID=A0A819I0U2_9BILA|nr:unnamed protein product [Rotaria sordida]CAF3933697.1 unnamed protein product [Rotaria sordida]